jgi:hypothetical protein
MRKSTLLFGLITICFSTKAQLNQNEAAETVQLNTITTAVPFVMIGPDSRSGAMGDAGVALSPDANAAFWNPAKLGFVTNELEVSLSYSPWLRALVPDMNLAYLTGYKKLDKKSAIAASLRFFSLGDINFTDDNGNAIRTFSPSEVSIDASYGVKLSKNFGGGIAVRFINSNLTGGINVGGANSKPGRSVAADIAMFYTKSNFEIAKKKATFNAGVNVSNIGAKMSYTDVGERDFIPTNLKLGPALTIEIDKTNQLTVQFEFNKLLVPTPPTYALDENGKPTIDPVTRKFVIDKGRDPDVSVTSGIFGSFNDAPGGVKEEMREVNIGGGFEYWYDKQFAFRGGYFYEHPTKGDRQYLTFGAGVNYSMLSIDLSYLVSTSNNNPLANTLRFTLRLNVAKLSDVKDQSAKEL